MKDSISYIKLCNKLGYNPYIKGNTKDFFVDSKLWIIEICIPINKLNYVGKKQWVTRR